MCDVCGSLEAFYSLLQYDLMSSPFFLLSSLPNVFSRLPSSFFHLHQGMDHRALASLLEHSGLNITKEVREATGDCYQVGTSPWYTIGTHYT